MVRAGSAAIRDTYVTHSDLCRIFDGHGLRMEPASGYRVVTVYCAVSVLVGDQATPEFS